MRGRAGLDWFGLALFGWCITLRYPVAGFGYRSMIVFFNSSLVCCVLCVVVLWGGWSGLRCVA
ncbi:hypothetical protein B0T26DRAFT_712607 [Lasiosphaeria miniovina]|uniref:Uncharacterized protein n=1 Tax=Lasiosphaeria miniovina TaxID=1954250 RepID=A0AA40DYF9_9PEZI|nr:uncharacterized protein B0T26DRAFT_712607 [Lasiosphaeria miniovina]KAK0718267.1 hypothetical protein B0T26DRAFT_712607 [Lasiosphaeria miniovina]